MQQFHSEGVTYFLIVLNEVKSIISSPISMIQKQIIVFRFDKMNVSSYRS